MSKGDPYKSGFRDGYRVAITVLHEWAKTMNDPHAASVLNSAAFHLGQERQRINVLPTEQTSDSNRPHPQSGAGRSAKRE